MGNSHTAGPARHDHHRGLRTVAIIEATKGVLVLLAMWIAHLLLFVRDGGLAAWVGTIAVVDNIVSSLFNSHLFDFLQGWVYVFGVGVAGGMALQKCEPSIVRESADPRC